MTVLSKFGVLLVGQESTEGSLQTLTVKTATASKTTFHLTGGAVADKEDDYFNNHDFCLYVKSGDAAGQLRKITDWTKTGKTVIVDAFSTTIDSGDTVEAVKIVLAEMPDGDKNLDIVRRDKLWDGTYGLSERGSIAAGYNPALKVVCDWRQSGTAAGDNFPDYNDLIRCAGFRESTSGTNTIVYQPNTGGAANQTSVSVYEYHKDGISKVYTGCKAESMNFDSESGGIPKVTFSLQALGITQSTATCPSLPLSAINEITALPVLGVTFTVNAVAEYNSKFGVAVKNTLTRVKQQAAASGTGKLVIAGREITTSFDVEADDDTQLDQKDAQSQLKVSWADGSAGNKSTIYLPKMAYTSVKHKDDGGIEKFDCEGRAHFSAGNDEITITIE
jgi:hypothetical protein